MGGVQTGRDVLELVACGATHVALGTVLFADPYAPERVRAELVDEVARAGYASVDEAYCASFETVARTAN
jgi:dihydroorotate dehydrogenase (NAD+) catalytic subunit